MLLDNPFIGIDNESKHAIFKLMDYLIEQGKRLIYTTIIIRFADSTTNILYLQENGKYEKILKKILAK